MSKQFLIIGNMNAVTYKEIFPYVKDNLLWFGYSVNKTVEFKLDKNYDKWDSIDDNGYKYGSGPSITWYTNIENNKINEQLTLTQTYSPDKYLTYDNYNAIEVSMVKDIPKDYYGVMGVPISFISKYCPTQFQIVGAYNYSKDYDGNTWNAKINGKYIYKRLLIKRLKNNETKEI